MPRELKCLATDGRLSLIAFLGGTRTTLDMGDILYRRLTITGSTCGASAATTKRRTAPSSSTCPAS